MNLKVGILGTTGRMGKELLALLDPQFQLGPDTLVYVKAISNDRKVSLNEGISVDVWIDFSRPEATLMLLEQIRSPIVICTTGFTEAQMKKIHEYAKDHPVFLTANTSPGMSLMMQMLNNSPIESFSEDDVVASEIHHRKKQDSPSGTLKSLLQILEKKGIKNAQVQSARVGDEKGTHIISFFSDDEELTLTHRVNHRRVFAKGALIAARYIAAQKKPGLYCSVNQSAQ